MGNLEKLGILVIVILVVVVGVVAMTPKSTLDERLYPDQPQQQAADAATPPETLEPAPSDVKKDDVWPAGKDGALPNAAKPLPIVETSADPKAPAAAATPTFRTIKVQANDTLATIAKRELGNAARFKEIVDANPGLQANKLKKGMEIKIPVSPAAAAAPTNATAKTTAPTTTTTTAGSSASPTAGPAEPAATTEKSEHVYVVKAGDTLSSIAGHELGSTKRWSEIAKANEDVLHGSTALKVGMKLQIPGDAGPSTSGASTNVAARDLAPAPSAGGSTSTSGEREYVVKAGDTLWGIAKSEMGGGESFVKELRAANQDVLKGSDNLRVGMKLKLPAKK
jgi:nucleoid-associated protein YgaU